MAEQTDSIWHQIGEYARYAPTPHNTQPLRIKVIDEKNAELYYDLTRALPEGDPPARFALAAVGIFTEAIKIAAASKKFRLDFRYEAEPLRTKTMNGLQKVAIYKLVDEPNIQDLPVELLQKRRTNRLPYNNKKLDATALKEIQQEAAKFGHTFEVRDDPASVGWVSNLNKRMVFYDLDEDNVRNELAHWSRFTKKRAHQTKDGLSAECLHVPGWGLWLFMDHYGFLRVPGIRQLLQWIYWQNMQGITTVAWLQGKFFNEADYLQSGQVLLRVWLLMAKNNIAYHPFGSVITNKRAHDEFRDHFQIDETKAMAWLLMRVGYTDQEPPRSERLPLEDYFV